MRIKKKMRTYNDEYMDIIAFLKREGHTEMVSYLQNNPPKMENYGRGDIITLIPLTDALKEAHEKTNTMLMEYQGNNLDNLNTVMADWFSKKDKKTTAWQKQLQR